MCSTFLGHTLVIRKTVDKEAANKSNKKNKTKKNLEKALATADAKGANITSSSSGGSNNNDDGEEEIIIARMVLTEKHRKRIVMSKLLASTYSDTEIFQLSEQVSVFSVCVCLLVVCVSFFSSFSSPPHPFLCLTGSSCLEGKACIQSRTTHRNGKPACQHGKIYSGWLQLIRRLVSFLLLYV